MTNYDILVVGGGPGGYIAAVTAAKYGFSVALIEKEPEQGGGLGGTCLNRGCIPSKTWLDNAETIERVKQASKRGIDAQVVNIDMPAMVKFKDRVVKRLSMGVGALLKSWNVTVYNGTATVHDLDNVVVTSSKDKENEIVLGCKRLILATGSRPATIPIPGADLPQVLTSDDIFNIQTIPPRLTIVGGGVIGVEMARIFSAFGSKVTIVEALPRLAPNLDEEIADALAKSLKSAKIAIKTGVKVEAIDPADGEEVSVVISSDGKREFIPSDVVLMAVGRAPNTDAFSELWLDMKGRFVKVDPATLKTSDPHVYAIGDITGLSMLAHSASTMGERAAKVAVQSLNGSDSDEFYPFPIDYASIPSVVYGEPSAASVGMSQQTAEEYCAGNSLTLSIGRTIFGGNGRAVASGMGEGFVKILVASGDCQTRILGIHIFGPMASELINEASVLVNGTADVQRAASVVHAHPTFGETLSIALHDALGGSSHQPPKK